jgi:transcriptional regulator with PAS, ATPase and Fis domain
MAVDPRDNKGALAQLSQWLAREHGHILAVLNRLRVGVIIIDADGLVVFTTHAVEQLFDRDHADALGQPWHEVLPFDDTTKARIFELLEQGAADRRRVAARWRSGAHRRLWSELEVAEDPDEPSNRLLIFYDLTRVAEIDGDSSDVPRFEGIFGQSRGMQEVSREIRLVARADTTVLIEGETGTGKELVARAIHTASPRRDRAFVALNCAGLSESLLGSQLFGHRRGAFTGAVADSQGLFEAAHGGTLFLDEIGDIPLPVQSALLRVLQEKEITRLGETRPRKIDVRILSATHRDLAGEVAAGNFRDDLFYRICVARIALPPLRERLDDLPTLVGEFLRQACASLKMPRPQVDSDTMGALAGYTWPGNVRELKSAVESAVLHCDGGVIHPSDLPPEISGLWHRRHAADPHAECERLQSALRRAKGNRTKAAQLLGVSRATFYRLLSKSCTT